MAAPVLAPMPENLDLQAGYTLRVVALDPSTGNQVANVNIGQTVITATNISPAAAGTFAFGDWALVPGPMA